MNGTLPSGINLGSKNRSTPDVTQCKTGVFALVYDLTVAAAVAKAGAGAEQPSELDPHRYSCASNLSKTNKQHGNNSGSLGLLATKVAAQNSSSACRGIQS